MRSLAWYATVATSLATVAAVCAHPPASSPARNEGAREERGEASAVALAPAQRAAQRPSAPSAEQQPTAGPPEAPTAPPPVVANAPARAVAPGPPCVADADCRMPPGPERRRGRCLTAALLAQYTQAFARCEASAAWRDAHPVDRCVYDECNDAESPGGDTCGAGQRCGILEMAPLPVRVCVPAECTTDFQCRREAGGRCAAYLTASRCARGGWACSYPRDACAPRDPSRMCAQVDDGRSRYCRPSGPRGRFVCEPQSDAPP